MQNNDCINKLKYLKHKSIDIFYNYKWENLDNIEIKDDKCYKIRLLYKPSSFFSTPSNFLNKTLVACHKQHTTAIYKFESIKILACIEQYFFDGDIIRYDQLGNVWIIPINISFLYPHINMWLENYFFSSENYCDYHGSEMCKCVNDEGTFIVQLQQDNNISHSKLGAHLKSVDYDNYLKPKIEIFFESNNNILFTIVWINDFSTFMYCKYNEKLVNKHDFKFVDIYDKKAIIIPTSGISMQVIKYLLYSLDYNNQDLINLKTNDQKGSYLELYFCNNIKQLAINIFYFK